MANGSRQSQKEQRRGGRFHVRITDPGVQGLQLAPHGALDGAWNGQGGIAQLPLVGAERAQRTAIEPPRDPEHPPTRESFWVAGRSSRVSCIAALLLCCRQRPNRGLRPEASASVLPLCYLWPSLSATAWGFSVGTLSTPSCLAIARDEPWSPGSWPVGLNELRILISALASPCTRYS